MSLVGTPSHVDTHGIEAARHGHQHADANDGWTRVFDVALGEGAAAQRSLAVSRD